MYAWGNMLASYSQESGFLKGAVDTFSGEKPCHLCCEIEEAKKSDSRNGGKDDPVAPLTASKTVEFLATREHFLSPPAACEAPGITFVRPDLKGGTGALSPPRPPPRRTV